MQRLVLSVATALFALSSHAMAGTDPADIAFCQAIQGSTNPAKYQAYLDAFPTGTFAALARVRVKAPPVAQAPTAQIDATAPDQAMSPPPSTNGAMKTGGSCSRRRRVPGSM